MSDPESIAQEQLRLENCAREPIRTPGRIQSHGVVLGVDNRTREIVYVSENAGGLLGHTLEDPNLLAALETGSAIDPIRIPFADGLYDVIVHPGTTRTLIELEEAVVGMEYVRTAVVGAIQRLSSVRDVAELRRAAAREIKAITGFDRVMVYHFFPDGHGEVVADERAEDMEPYLGLHFPASDIPTQARQLYITKLSRSIVRTDDPGIPLLAIADDPTAIDLSEAELRAVSPYHLQYMRNMGQASTVSFSLIMDGELIGMITCAHRETRRLPVLLRRSIEVVASQLAMQLDAIGQIDRLKHDVEVRERRAALLAPLFASDDMVGTLLRGEQTVLDLIPADGVALRIGDEIHTRGAVPAQSELKRLIVTVGETQVATHMLERDRPDLAALVPDAAGLISVSLGAGNCVMFFRNEVTRVVDWLGDPGPDNRPDPLSPRLSFSSWQESVAGTAEPWGTVVDEAAQLGQELQGALLRRAEARLAELAMHDALTGLRNRRFFADNLERALQERRRPDSVSLLFVDLDDFKGINDTYGHDAGDAVIVEVGRRLVASSRTADAVARLGGDEFVVVCEHTTPQDARSIADRIVAAVGVPIAARGALITVTASCGIVTADDATTGAALLEAADAAMYRAKAGGRNRVAI